MTTEVLRLDLRSRLDVIGVGPVDSRAMAYRVLVASGISFPPPTELVDSLDAECRVLVGGNKMFGEGDYPELILREDHEKPVDSWEEDLTPDDLAYLTNGAYRYTEREYTEGIDDASDGTIALFSPLDAAVVGEETAWKSAINQVLVDLVGWQEKYGASFTTDMVLADAWAMLDPDSMPDEKLQLRLDQYTLGKMEAMK